MGWETRERGSSYYTRSKWKDGRILREYIGTGPLAQLAAQWDELERLEREEKAAHEREKQEDFARSAGFLSELEATAEVLVRACLLADGFHLRQGEWRRRRESA